MKSNNKVAAYIRLSREDKQDKSESLSITNQRALLTDYAEQRGWTIAKEYVDDGFSGMNYDRPKFMEMKLDIERGIIDTVITKDMSRLGRDSSETTYYIKKYFPLKGIRYIAVSDNIDTAEGIDIRVGMHSIVNEIYAEDISIKSKAAKRSRAKQGKFLGSQAPYGYMKSPDDKNQLIVDEYAAVVVRRVFELSAQGYSARAISDKLNGEKVLSPREYHYQRKGKPNPYKTESKAWGSHTITNMLKSEVYIGHLVQGKRENKSPLLKMRCCVPKEEWIRVENAHEPIIDELVWNKVQALLAKNSHGTRVGRSTKRNGEVSLFKGKVFCMDCGSQMNFTTSRGVHKDYHKYRCSTNANNGKLACSYNAIQECDLSEVVLADINRVTEALIRDEKALLSDIMKMSNVQHIKHTQDVQKDIRELENEIAALEQNCEKLAVEKFEGTVSVDMFKRLMSGFEAKLADKESKLAEQRDELYRLEQEANHAEEILDSFHKYIHLETLDRAAVVELIDKIIVGKPYKKDGRNQRKIEIHYNFIGTI